LNLTLILFLPWCLALATLFWMLPRKPHPMVRVAFDPMALVVSTFWYSMRRSVHIVDANYGKL